MMTLVMLHMISEFSTMRVLLKVEDISPHLRADVEASAYLVPT
jgi:hypothetical protein